MILNILCTGTTTSASTSACMSTSGSTSTSTSASTGTSIEEQKCQEFLERTCGCRLNNGSPCSSLIPLEKYVSHRYEAAALTRDQLDLVLIGAVMSLVNTNDKTFDKNHKSKTRQRIHSHYLFGGQHICRYTFQFLLGVGKDCLHAIKASYMENGLTIRIHGNTKRLPHNVTTFEQIQNIVRFISNFAEEQAILLPGRIPGYKRDDIKLLPSSTSKKVKCNNFMT